MVYKFYDKKTSATRANKFTGSGIKNENLLNKELAQGLYKPIITKFGKIKVNSPFIENIWGADYADMQKISKFICVIDIYSKYTSVIPLTDKKGIIVTNAFQKVLYESNRKPNKIWTDKDSELYNRSMKSWLEKLT